MNNNPVKLKDPNGKQACDTDDSECRTYVGIEEIGNYDSNYYYALENLNPNLANQIKLEPFNVSSIFSDPSLYLSVQNNIAWYDPKTDSISLPEGGTADYLLHMVNIELQKVLPGYALTKELILLHESRHFWQRHYDPHRSFVYFISEEALKSGLLLDADPSQGYELTLNDDANLLLRPSTIGTDGTSTSVSWNHPDEIDATIAELMFNENRNQEFKDKYPRIWNFMLSQPGYFNQDKYKQFLYNQRQKPGTFSKERVN